MVESTAANCVRPTDAIVLLAVLLLAAIPRLHRLGDAPLWGDELHSARFAAGAAYRLAAIPAHQIIANPPPVTGPRGESSWLDIIPGALVDTHPPLYSLFLRLWQEIGGGGDAWLRGFSVLASLLAIALLYDAVRLLNGPAAAAWAAVLMALAPPHIRYAQETRSYALIIAEGMTACAAMVRIESLGINRRRLAALALASFALLTTHYLAWAGVAILGLYTLLRFRGPTLYRVLAAFAVAALLLLATWGPWMFRQIAGASSIAGWLYSGAPGHTAQTLDRLIALPARFFGEPTYDHDVALRYLVVAVMLILAVRRRPLHLWAMWTVGLIALPAGMDLAQSLNSLRWIRFTLAASPGVYALAAAPAARGAFFHLLPAALAITCLMSHAQAYDRPRPAWRELAARLDQATSADLIVICSIGDGPWEAHHAYLGLQHYANRLPGPLLLLTQEPSADLLRQWASYERILLVRTPPAQLPVAAMADWDVASQQPFDGVGVLHELTRRP